MPPTCRGHVERSPDLYNLHPYHKPGQSSIVRISSRSLGTSLAYNNTTRVPSLSRFRAIPEPTSSIRLLISSRDNGM